MSLINNRDFLKLWSGQTISAFGTDLAALEFTALLFLNATPSQMGLLAASTGAPVLVLGLLAGVWVDRVRRRPLLIAADVGRAAVLISVPVVAVLDTLKMEQLYLVAAVSASLTLLFKLAYRSYLPSLVEREHLVEANSKLSITESLAEICGPAAGGALVQIASAPFAVAVDAASFLASALSVRLIRAPELQNPAVHPNARLEIGEGLQAIRTSPVLRALLATSAIMAFFGGFIGALYALYLIRTLGFSPVVMGLTIGAGGVGSVLGGALAASFSHRVGLGPAMIVSRLIHNGLTFLIPLASGSSTAALAMLLVSQLVGDPFWTIYDINALSLRQTITDARLLGRVNAGFHIVEAGLVPVGALAGGLLAGQIGVRTTLYLAATGMLLSSIPLILSPIVRLKQMPQVVPGSE